MMEFQKKYGPWALVIGASEGLGAAFASYCARRGLNVALVARRATALQQVASGLEDQYGVLTRTIPADCAAHDFGARLFEKAGDLDIGLMIFNAAATNGRAPFLKMSIEENLENIQVNCVAPTRVAHWLGRDMIKKGRGALIFVSSTGCYQGLTTYATYSATKSFEMIFGEALWDELRDHGVLAASYMVGSTATPTHMKYKTVRDAKDPGIGKAEGEPRSCEEVANALFDQLESGPRIYCHPDEEALFKRSSAGSRRELIEAQGARMRHRSASSLQ
jgi:short-subunit dehydrogenase